MASRIKVRGAAGVLFVGACLYAAAAIPVAADTAPNGLIAFASSADGDYDIYSMNPDGSNVLNLTGPEPWDGVDETAPRWSPDGTRIAFTRSAEGTDLEIVVMNADGSAVQQLTNNGNADDDWGPAWSPDGSKIAWTAYHTSDETYDFDVWTMDANGGNKVNITGADDDFGLDFNEWQPDWSPDGSRIVMSALRWWDDPDATEEVDHSGAYYRIATVRPDGTDERLLTAHDDADGIPNHHEYPRWAPDGSWISFMLNPQPEQGWDVAIVHPDGTNETNLTNTYLGDEMFPTWSPDGTQLLFTLNDELWAINVADFPAGGPTSRMAAATSTLQAGGVPKQRVTSMKGIRHPDWQRAESNARQCTITGTSDADVLDGTPERDVICGGGGNDVLRGLGGSDLLIGGPGADRLLGGRGSDVIEGGGGRDYLDGGRGVDHLDGGAGVDACRHGGGTGTKLACES